MKFALFYEIPVPKPWGPEDEFQAYQNTIEQAVAGEKAGFHAFWTVEHHFLDEYSHCSNPEVLYGAIAAKTERIRLGYGVRLMPKPYNHPVRTAESVAVLDLISDGRVDFGTGRSSTRAELEGFDVDVDTAREQWAEAIGHVVTCWTNEDVELNGKHWSMPKRNVHPKPRQKPHPPIFGATSPASRATTRWARPASASAPSPSASRPRSWSPASRTTAGARPTARSRSAPSATTQVATFTMVLCAPTERGGRRRGGGVLHLVPRGRRPADRVGGRVAGGEAAGPRHLRLRRQRQEAGRRRDARPPHLRLHPGLGLGGRRRPRARCLEMAKRYEAVGVDLLLCLVNPYKISHEQVMQTIELMGEHVIPQFD